jgi:hypothetical protein
MQDMSTYMAAFAPIRSWFRNQELDSSIRIGYYAVGVQISRFVLGGATCMSPEHLRPS